MESARAVPQDYGRDPGVAELSELSVVVLTHSDVYLHIS